MLVGLALAFAAYNLLRPYPELVVFGCADYGVRVRLYRHWLRPGGVHRRVRDRRYFRGDAPGVTPIHDLIPAVACSQEWLQATFFSVAGVIGQVGSARGMKWTSELQRLRPVLSTVAT